MPSVVEQTPYNQYTGNGVATVYPYEFQLLNASDLVVKVNGVVIPSSSFTLAGVGVQAGGTVTFTVAPVSGAIVLLSREIALQRDIDYQNNGDLQSPTVNLDFNRIWQALQGWFARLGGSIRAPYPEQLDELPDAATRANKTLAFNATGQPTVLVPVSGSAADVLIQLASTASASVGTGLLGWLRAATGAVASTLYAWLDWQNVHVFEFMTLAQRIDVKARTNTLDVSAAINAANAAVAAKTCGGVLKFTDGLYRCTSAISIPDNVSWEGENYPQTNGAGTTWASGVCIYKAHTGNAVSMVSGNNAGVIRRIGIWSDKAIYAAGNGFVLGPAAGCRLIDCTVRTVKGDSFVIGNNTSASYTNTLENCYSNNPDGRNFVVAGQWFRGDLIISDGGTIGFDVLSQANRWTVSRAHFEGYTTHGARLGNGRGCFSGYNVFLPYIGTTKGVSFTNTSGVQDVELANCYIFSASAGVGSIGVEFAGGSNVRNTVRKCEIVGFETGILDAGSYNTIDDCDISACTLPINLNGNRYTITNTVTSGTTGLYSIAHNAGTIGIIRDNTLDRTLNPVLSGVQGNFSGIKVKDNIGYVSRNIGQNTVATTVAFAHGLAGVPSPDIVINTTTAGVTSSPQLTTQSATQIGFAWTGTTPAQWGWCAHLPCDY